MKEFHEIEPIFDSFNESKGIVEAEDYKNKRLLLLRKI